MLSGGRTAPLPPDSSKGATSSSVAGKLHHGPQAMPTHLHNGVGHVTAYYGGHAAHRAALAMHVHGGVVHSSGMFARNGGKVLVHCGTPPFGSPPREGAGGAHSLYDHSVSPAQCGFGEQTKRSSLAPYSESSRRDHSYYAGSSWGAMLDASGSSYSLDDGGSSSSSASSWNSSSDELFDNTWTGKLINPLAQQSSRPQSSVADGRPTTADDPYHTPHAQHKVVGAQADDASSPIILDDSFYSKTPPTAVQRSLAVAARKEAARQKLLPYGGDLFSKASPWQDEGEHEKLSSTTDHDMSSNAWSSDGDYLEEVDDSDGAAHGDVGVNELLGGNLGEQLSEARSLSKLAEGMRSAARSASEQDTVGINGDATGSNASASSPAVSSGKASTSNEQTDASVVAGGSGDKNLTNSSSKFPASILKTSGVGGADTASATDTSGAPGTDRRVTFGGETVTPPDGLGAVPTKKPDHAEEGSTSL